MPDSSEEGSDSVVDNVDCVEENQDELVEEKLGHENTARAKFGAAERKDEGIHCTVTWK